MKIYGLNIWIGMVLGLGLINPAGATLSLPAEADSYIERTNSKKSMAVNYGDSEILMVKNGGANWNRKAYMRFDVSGVEKQTLESAYLNLTMADSKKGMENKGQDWVFNVFGLRDNAGGSDWDEAGITWNAAPAQVSGSGHKLNADALLLGQFKIQGKGLSDPRVMWGGTSLVDFLRADTDGAVTLMVTRETRKGPNYVHAFAAREYGDGMMGPTLTVSGMKVPEPAVTAFLLTGWMLMKRRRSTQG